MPHSFRFVASIRSMKTARRASVEYDFYNRLCYFRYSRRSPG